MNRVVGIVPWNRFLGSLKVKILFQLSRSSDSIAKLAAAKPWLYLYGHWILIPLLPSAGSLEGKKEEERAAELARDMSVSMHRH
jgi:hypothetical protein